MKNSSEQKFYKHPAALVENASVGNGTRIWAFAHVLDGAQIGEHCNICDGVFIEGCARIGDRVTIKCGVQIWDGVEIEDDVFIGPNATFTNDPFPRSKQRPKLYARTRVRVGASIGANATILPGVTIGSKAMVGAGALVSHDVPPHAIVYGNPARIIGYETGSPVSIEIGHRNDHLQEQSPQLCRGVKVIDLPSILDMRGKLAFGEFPKHLPFEPKRFFVVFDVPSSKIRGEHSHKKLKQILVCLKGSVHVMLDDGINRVQYLLDEPTKAVYIPPLIWSTQFKHSDDALLLVLASDIYDDGDYIRNYDEFLRLIRQA
jgi:acetyltransferase-like isoleucine patch superfamily enzyme/dTDP-4-dehydrorhamnose 3,5-epimerase-like enzyme